MKNKKRRNFSDIELWDNGFEYGLRFKDGTIISYSITQHVHSEDEKTKFANSLIKQLHKDNKLKK